MPHAVYALLMALLLAGCAALEGPRPTRERIYSAVYMFGSCAGCVVAGGWIMHWIHGSS